MGKTFLKVLSKIENYAGFGNDTTRITLKGQESNVLKDAK